MYRWYKMCMATCQQLILSQHTQHLQPKVILVWDNDKYYAAVNNLGHVNLPIHEDEIPIAAHEMVTDFSCAISQESNKGVSLVNTSDPGNLPITTVGDTVYAVVRSDDVNTLPSQEPDDGVVTVDLSSMQCEPTAVPENEENEITSLLQLLNADYVIQPESITDHVQEISTVDKEALCDITSIHNNMPSPSYHSDLVIDESAESCQQRSPPKPRKDKGKKLDMEIFTAIVPEVVDSIPHAIDGDGIYYIKCSEGENNEEDDTSWQRRYKDGRYFQLHTSRRKGFTGTRRIGRCRGNFKCINGQCPYLLSTGRASTHQFITKGVEKFCFTCNCVCIREDCGAIKLIEFSSHNNLLIVYHTGHHTCTPKIYLQENDKFIQSAIEETGGALGPKEIAHMKMTQEMKRQQKTGEYDINRIVDIASKLTDRQRIADIKRSMLSEAKVEKHSICCG